MRRRTLFILLEGNDDERFFNAILVPLIRRHRHSVKIWKYAREKRNKTERFIRSLRAMGASCIYVRDIDNGPTVAAKKRYLVEWYNGALSPDDIAVVVMEIESWYMAGADRTMLRTIGISRDIPFTNTLTKEEFNAMIPRSSSRILVMQELLRHFDLETAARKNRSFNYFLHHWIRADESY